MFNNEPITLNKYKTEKSDVAEQMENAAEFSLAAKNIWKTDIANNYDFFKFLRPNFFGRIFY